MKTLLLSSLLTVSILTGCKSKPSCDDVIDHTMSLMPAEMQGKLKDQKAQAVAKCEKMSPDARKCALDATSLEDLMKCPKQ